ncbi:MAG: hypothetical protein M5U28_32510 [Sandaracinaceae bacterium]|nr:hypothetical protein [Sandaracinaceae bacterium]
MEHQEIDEPPALLVPDNFTPPSRTPWGGARIRALKARWVGAGDAVGESWELSVEPSFPSRTEDGAPLAARIAARPRAWLGRQEAEGGAALLVKLLDAAQALSVQIHPSDGYAGLAEGEGQARELVRGGAGSGLGDLPRAGRGRGPRRRGARARRGQGPLAAAHLRARRAGRLLPHRGRHGALHRRGRDAGRAAAGGPGEARRDLPLLGLGASLRRERASVERGGAARAPPRARPRRDGLERAAGEALLARARLRAGEPRLEAAARAEVLCGPGGLGSRELFVARLSGRGELELPGAGALRAVTVLAGAVELEPGLLVEAGRTAAVPASARPRARLHEAHAIVAAAP